MVGVYQSVVSRQFVSRQAHLLHLSVYACLCLSPRPSKTDSFSRRLSCSTQPHQDLPLLTYSKKRKIRVRKLWELIIRATARSGCGRPRSGNKTYIKTIPKYQQNNTGGLAESLARRILRSPSIPHRTHVSGLKTPPGKTAGVGVEPAEIPSLFRFHEKDFPSC